MAAANTQQPQMTRPMPASGRVFLRTSHGLIPIDSSRQYEHRRVTMNIADEFRLDPARCPKSTWSDVPCSCRVTQHQVGAEHCGDPVIAGPLLQLASL